jgi:exodeoxyribonuclease V alpha subunit
VDRWGAERETARRAAQTVLDGPGRLGFRRAAVARASDQLARWHATWAPHLPSLPADNVRLVRAVAGDDDQLAVRTALDAAARRAAGQAHPEHAAATAAVHAAERAHLAAQRELDRARYDHGNRYGVPGAADYVRQLVDAERVLAATRQELTNARARVGQLQVEPAIVAQPADRLDREREAWHTGREAEQAARRARTTPPFGRERLATPVPPAPPLSLSQRPTPGRGISW